MTTVEIENVAGGYIITTHRFKYRGKRIFPTIDAVIEYCRQTFEEELRKG